MEVIRISNKQQLLKNLQELDTKLENREISKKQYKALKKQYHEKLESIEVIERIRRMQGNTTPYEETKQAQEVETERTKAHDKEIIQKYITKEAKTEILEQTQKDDEYDKSLLKKYLKPENEEVSEGKLNRPKLNDPEEEELIKKFITDPTSKKEAKTKTNLDDGLDSVGKLKYSKPNKKVKTDDTKKVIEKTNSSKPVKKIDDDGEEKVAKKTKSTPEERKKAILSIISGFGKKTKEESPKEEVKTEPKVENTEPKPTTNKETKTEPEIENTEPKPTNNEETKTDKLVKKEELKTKETIDKLEVKDKPVTPEPKDITEKPKIEDKHHHSKIEEIVEKTEIKNKPSTTEPKKTITNLETKDKPSTPKEEPKPEKKERPKLKESIIVGSEDILKPKKENKKEIPIKDVSSILDSDTPKPKPKESINVSSKQVSDAISYAMGESTTTILKIDEITESPQKDNKTKEDMFHGGVNKEESDIKPFFGFKVGSDTENTDSKSNSLTEPKIPKGTIESKEKPHKKPVFSESVKDSVINAKPEKDKKPVFKTTKTPKTEIKEEELKKDSKTKINGYKKVGESDIEEPSPKQTGSNRPVFAVKSNDELLNSEKLKTENRPRIDTSKSISDFKKTKESKNPKKDSKNKDNIDSATIYPTKQKKDNDSIMKNSGTDIKSENDDANKREKIILGGTIIGIILIILVAFGISTLTSTPSDTTLYIDDTALAPNNTNQNNTTSSYAPTSASSSYNTVSYTNPDTTNDYTYKPYQNDDYKYKYNQYRNSNQSSNPSKPSNNNSNSNTPNKNDDSYKPGSDTKPSSDGSSTNSSKNTKNTKNKNSTKTN